MTNLKELKIVRCGLDGECLVYVQVNTTSLRNVSHAQDQSRSSFYVGSSSKGAGAVELKDNAGLELPADIGELGDSVTQIDLSEHNLRGM